MTFRRILLSIALAGTLVSSLRGDEVDRLLEGKGSAAARKAAVQLGDRDLDLLPRLLAAMDTGNLVAANWYRTIYERLTRTALARDPRPRFPIKFLKDYAADPRRQGRTRRLVLALLDRLEPKFRGELIPGMLSDPEFRDEAVAVALSRGDAHKSDGDLPAAGRAYAIAFQHARSAGQITTAAAGLAATGQPVNIVEHMGFVTDWYLLGPFEAPDRSGFDLSFPPDKAVKLDASYPGKANKPIGWKRFQTSDRFGQLNLIQAIAPVAEAVGYAYAELDSPRAVDCQLRAGADDNLTVWLNGRKVLSNRQWLNGTRLDRFSAPVRLKRGRNRLLVKVCQGPQQHKNPAVPNNWSLQLRFCDAAGGGIKTRSALPAGESKQR